MGAAAKRQMSLVGFMQAGNTTVYAGSWRHPATEHGFLSASYYQKLGRTLEEGCFDLMFFDDRLAMPGIYGGSVAEAVRRGARPVKLDLSIVLGVLRRRHPLDRPRGHLLDDLLLAVPRGPHLRHARPPLRRAGGLERGHVGQRQRGPELRRRRSTSATTSATTAPTSSSRRPPACGTRGRTTPSSSTARAGVFADPDKVHELDYEGEWFQVAGPAHRAPLAAGPAGAAAGRVVGAGPRLRRPLGRADLHRRPRHRHRPVPLQGPEGAHRRARARPGIGQDAADGLHGGRRVAGPRRGARAAVPQRPRRTRWRR